MPKLTIDGREFEVPAGVTVLQAALANGIEIPHYCYHPGLEIAGNCRICLVEIEKNPRPQIACNTFVADGMVVHTTSDKVQAWQNAVMEFLLINHPLDCPICDQAGECKLQDYSFRFGKPTTRFEEEKEHGPKRRELGPHVVFDWERCIKCTRCIRFCDEVPQTGELGMFLRGVREEIGVFPGKPLDNPYSGNVVDICPVGALTLREFRFRSRVWFVTNVATTCPGCARGCSIEAGQFRNEIFRITPRENQAVNRWWICDEGRLWGERLQAAEKTRLSGVAGAGATGADPYMGAIAAASQALVTSAAVKRVAVLASGRATVEETYQLARIAKHLGAAVYLPAHERGADDDVLLRRDKTPNQRGARAVLEALCGTVRSATDLKTELEGGQVDAVLALGPGLVGPVDGEAEIVPGAAWSKAQARIVIDAHPSSLSQAATTLLPAATYGEVTGAYVNFAGRVQHVERALTPKTDCRPALMILEDLLAQIGAPAAAQGVDGVRAAVTRDVPAFAGIRWDELIASTGQDLAGCDAAAAACKPTGALRNILKSGYQPAHL